MIGGEESFGLMIEDAVRDKDALSASLAACEMISYYKQKILQFSRVNKTLLPSWFLQEN
ncbi:MAG: hypothetical protein CM15mP36_12330 [Flavobacteriales bacterium]|nr:MAG: hypothetical protein CM15mP36_12330 [Flavobacteriales bacterium]